MSKYGRRRPDDRRRPMECFKCHQVNTAKVVETRKNLLGELTQITLACTCSPCTASLTGDSWVDVVGAWNLRLKNVRTAAAMAKRIDKVMEVDFS